MVQGDSMTESTTVPRTDEEILSFAECIGALIDSIESGEHSFVNKKGMEMLEALYYSCHEILEQRKEEEYKYLTVSAKMVNLVEKIDAGGWYSYPDKGGK